MKIWVLYWYDDGLDENERLITLHRTEAGAEARAAQLLSELDDDSLGSATWEIAQLDLED